MQTSSRTYSLASCYENPLTVILRLWSFQQVGSISSQDFRSSIRAALKAAMEQAKSMGYSSEINQLACFAMVAFLDENVLKLQNPAFADWAQSPEQAVMFGHNRAGEFFFDHLQTLLTRQDGPEVAYCLEVYCLCMLLGFKGKYALSSSITSLLGQQPQAAANVTRPTGEIQTLIRMCRDKIDRIRGKALFFPDFAAPQVKQVSTVDRVSRGLGIAALALFLITLLSFVGFWILLSSGASQIS